MGDGSRMTEPRQTLQFELDADAIRLLYRSVRFHLDKWPGGPDPREQEDLHRLQTLLYAALLECSFDQDVETLIVAAEDNHITFHRNADKGAAAPYN